MANISRRKSLKFIENQYVVYPAHGVGKIVSLETDIISGYKMECYIIKFEHSRMLLKLPLSNVQKTGLRKLSTKTELQVALKRLKEKKQKAKGLWNHRTAEYETKLNSGVLVKVAEVLRDLAGPKSAEDEELSFSERNLYQEALTRMVWEMACIEEIDIQEAQARIMKLMGKSV